MKNLKVFEEKTSIREQDIKNYISKFKKIYGKNFLLFIRLNDIFTNKLDDYCFYLDGEKDLLLCMQCTTKAGNYYVYNPLTYGGITGTAVLKEGNYKNTYKVINTYRFGYLDYELIQILPVYIYRDSNRNNVLDRENLQYGYYGINIHTSGWTTIIDRWSAGCLSIYKPEWDWFKKKYLKINDIYSIKLITLSEILKEI